MHDPDPRPSIAAKLDHDLYARLGYASTEAILNEEIPEGAPWTAIWDTTGRTPRLAQIRAGGVDLWLCRHPEVVAADPYLADWSPYV